MSKSNTKPVKVESFPIEVSYVKGDKITIHKCDIDKAIKIIKSCSDPLGSADRDAGKIDILRELLYMIEKGKMVETSQKNKVIFKEVIKNSHEHNKGKTES